MSNAAKWHAFKSMNSPEKNLSLKFIDVWDVEKVQ